MIQTQVIFSGEENSGIAGIFPCIAVLGSAQVMGPNSMPSTRDAKMNLLKPPEFTALPPDPNMSDCCRCYKGNSAVYSEKLVLQYISGGTRI